MAITIHADADLIDQLGGPSALAARLGFTGPFRVQRVQNWKYRGIPEVIRLRHRELFEQAEADLDAARNERVAAVPGYQKAAA